MPDPSILIGPFSEILTMEGLPDKGPIDDKRLNIVKNGGIVVNDGIIAEVGAFTALKKKDIEVHPIETVAVVMPGLIDSHTHICFGGSRALDYSLRIAGKSYQDILREGGGIYATVDKTRNVSFDDLLRSTANRLSRHLSEGVTTCEIKSGYGLSLKEELKMLRVINKLKLETPSTVIASCLAAHVPPKEISDPQVYLNVILEELLPVIRREALSSRIDIFIEPEAFPPSTAAPFLSIVTQKGFDITVHADQFTSGGSRLAVESNALSADHLESSTEEDIKMLAASDITATVLPGASLGLGMNYAPARKLLDTGCRLAIATDWNPGSAPMGDLLTQASLISASEKLTTGETFAAITVRAAKALKLNDRGVLAPGMKADFISFPVSDHREILYHQGKLKPDNIWIDGRKI